MFDLKELPTYLREEEKVENSLLSEDLPLLQRAPDAQFFDKSSGCSKNEPSEDLPSDNDSWIIKEKPVSQEDLPHDVIHEQPRMIVPAFELKNSASIEK